MNIGGLLGPLPTVVTQISWGLHLGFGLAAVGTAFGLPEYAPGRRRLPAGVHHVPRPLPREQHGKWAGIAGAALLVLSPRIRRMTRGVR